MTPNNLKAMDALSNLKQHFLKGSLNFSLNLDEISNFTLDVQELFLHSTIHLDRFKRYPLNNNFCRKFFKKLIFYLEQEQEIHDEIYHFLCSEMEKPSEVDGVCYHHYIINQDCLITIKETKNMVVHGTTGMKTWEAAFMLADWLLCNKEIIENKKILELGSGVGFTGVAIAKNCEVQSVIMTDHHEEVLRTIVDNIKINFPEFQEEISPNITLYTGEQKTIGVEMLDWNCSENIQDEFIPDILIGADIVYDPSILPALCQVIVSFFRKNSNLQVYIASVIRNESTFEQFLKALDKFELKHEEISQLEPFCIEWDHTINKKFLKISI